MASWTSATPPPELPRPSTGTRRGVLRAADGSGRPRSEQVLPRDPDVARFVEHHWSLRWDLGTVPAGPAPRAVLSHPAIHLTVEDADGPLHGFPMPAVLVHGVIRRTFQVDLPPAGWVVGIRFRPGGFTAVTGRDADSLTDRIVRLDDADDLRDAVMAGDALSSRAEVLDAWLSSRLPATVPPDYERVLELVAAMVGDRSLQRTEDVAAVAGVSVRTLQRLFRRYVGVGPKWLLARYRLHDALAILDGPDPGPDTDRDRARPPGPAAGPAVDLAELATSLGWFDQAHFTRDFTAHVGVSPLAYLARPR